MSGSSTRQADGTWNYGAEGEVFPVESGQIWAVGTHVYVCSDLREDSLLREYLGSLPSEERPTLVYTDPPWGQSLLNSFRTKAGKEKASFRWEDLYGDIARLAHALNAPLWIEGSKPDSRDGRKILGSVEAAGAHAEQWWVKYYRKHISGLYYTGSTPYPSALKDELTGMDDDFTPLAVMQATAPTGIVLDPCGGRGVTSRCAEEAGWSSVLNEMHANRVSAGLVRLQKLTGKTPERIS